MRIRPVAATLAALVAVAVAVGCSGGDGASASGRTTEPRPTTAPTTTTPRRRVPGAAWEAATPASAGLDPAALDRIAGEAEAAGSRCLAVVRDGRVVDQRYWQGTDAATTQDIFSATKSITSVLVGIAQDDGKLRVDEPASTWIPEWRGTPSAAVTVRDLLSNDSGREWSLAIDYVQLLRARDRTGFAIGLGQAAPPGTVWAYNNSAIQTLQRVLQVATGQDVAEFARTRLFEPLGMASTSMAVDALGQAQMFEGVRSNCQDLARLGVLMLDHGRWGDRQVVSAAWVDASTGRSSTHLNDAYGYLWWLNRPGLVGDPLVATTLGDVGAGTHRGQLVPGAPEDLFWALGLGNQVVQVDPGSGTVVVRLGPASGRSTPPTFGPRQAAEVVTTAITR